MNNITSLFDLFNKAKTDDRYRRLAVFAYEEHYCSRGNFDLAKRWFDAWADRNYKLPTTKGFFSCRRMVDHINGFIYKIEDGALLMDERLERDGIN